MRLDLTPLDAAIAQLKEALAYHGSDLASRDPALKLHLRAAAIQAFEFTYELSFKMIKRHLEQASENPAQFDEMSFSAIMREAFRRGLVQSELSIWLHPAIPLTGPTTSAPTSSRTYGRGPWPIRVHSAGRRGTNCWVAVP